MIAATVQYQNVFQWADFQPMWAAWFLGVLVFGCLISFIWTKTVARKKNYGDSAFVLVTVLSIFGLAIPLGLIVQQFSDHFYDASKDAMVQNVKDKYGVSLELSESKKDSNIQSQNLSVPNIYTVTFSDGSKGNYTIRFDRQTSEPFITDGGGSYSSPTAQELNQKAAK